MKVTKSKLQEMVKETIANEVKGLTVGSLNDVQLVDKIEGEMLKILHHFKREEHGWLPVDELVNAFVDLHGNILGRMNLLKIAQKVRQMAGFHSGKPADPAVMSMEEEELPGLQKISTRVPMHPKLIARIKNLALYDLSDEEIINQLGSEVDGSVVTPRWVKFIANMVRKGLQETDISKMMRRAIRNARLDKETELNNVSTAGSMVAHKLTAGIIELRRQGKITGKTVPVSFMKEIMTLVLKNNLKPGELAKGVDLFTGPYASNPDPGAVPMMKALAKTIETKLFQQNKKGQ